MRQINRTTGTIEEKFNFVADAKITGLGEVNHYTTTGTVYQRVNAVISHRDGDKEEPFTMAGQAFVELSEAIKVGRKLRLRFVRTIRDGRSHLDVRSAVVPTAAIAARG